MDIAIWLILGAIAGFLAVLVMYRSIPNSPMEIIGAIVVGLIGGALGGWVTDMIGLEAVNWLGSIVIAFVFAVVILMLLRRVSPARG